MIRRYQGKGGRKNQKQKIKKSEEKNRVLRLFRTRRAAIGRSGKRVMRGEFAGVFADAR